MGFDWGDVDYGPGEGTTPFSSGWGSNLNVGPESGGGGGGFWGGLADLLKPAATAMLPAAGQAVAGGVFSSLFPGQGAQVRGMDTRTGTGMGAETNRMSLFPGASEAATGAGTRFKQLLGGGPYAAGMTPEEMAAEEQKIRTGSRNADAARGLSGGGGLETSGGALRETGAVEQFRRNQREVTNQEINRAGTMAGDLYGRAGNLTSGFQNLTPYSVPSRPSPWGNILTSTLAPAFGKGISSVLTKYMS